MKAYEPFHLLEVSSGVDLPKQGQLDFARRLNEKEERTAG